MIRNEEEKLIHLRNPHDELFSEVITEEIHLPKLNHIEISEEELEIEEDNLDDLKERKKIPFYNSVSRIMHASGDFQTPNPRCVHIILEFIRSITKIVFSDEVLTKAMKYYSPDLTKRVKFLKILKFLENVFQLETCTYFSSIEIKVIRL